MFEDDLARMLATCTLAEKLDCLRDLCPKDVQAIETLVEDCLAHRWPRTPHDWFRVADRLLARNHLLPFMAALLAEVC